LRYGFTLGLIVLLALLALAPARAKDVHDGEAYPDRISKSNGISI
jgi:hypothetical protein